MNATIENLKATIRNNLTKELDAYAWNRRGLNKFKSRPLESDESVTGYFKQLDGSVSSAEFDNLEDPIRNWTAGCDQQAASIRTFATKCLVLDVLTEAQYRAVIAEVDGKTVSTATPIINFGPGSIRLDAPITNNTTVRPVVDTTGDKEVVRDHSGKITGLRSVDRAS